VSVRIVLACSDPGIIEQFNTVVSESVDLELAEIAEDGRHLLDAVDGAEADVLVLHEGIGPLPALEVLREVALARPALGVVLLVAESRPETFAAAMESGARTLLTLPLSVEEVGDRVQAAAQWSRTVRSHLAGESLYGGGQRGRLVAVAGAKGGTGASILAISLALQSVADGRSTCLVDLDLQNGDIALLLGIEPRRSVVDLAEVADEITVRSLDEIAFRTEGGLTVVVAPEHGENGEDMTSRSSRMIFSALRMQFDVVVVDCGASVDDATAVVTEMADGVLLVTTPDVPSLRSARRRLDMWERLQIRKPDDVGIVLNRTSRRVEVQPDLAARVLSPTRLIGVVPAAFKELEEAVNTSAIPEMRNGAFTQAVAALATAAGISSDKPDRANSKRTRRGAVAPVPESGQIIAETPVVVALLVIVSLVLLQMLLWGWSHILASNAVQEAARTEAVQGNTCQVARDSISNGWSLDGCPDVDTHSQRVAVRVRTPSIVPGLGSLVATARTSYVEEDGP
jgi:pilus assembly protein CpaE